jgi:anaerobic ribonucleoside-triphosphate reductase
MLERMTFDNDFKECIGSITNNIRRIEAIDDESLDIAKRYRDYHISTESVTGEENANVGKSLHPSHRHGKIYESLEKMKSYEMLYVQMKKDYGKEIADKSLIEVLSGSLAINDSENIDLPYCVAFSSSHLMRNGRSYITEVPNTPPTTPRSYLNMTTEAMFDASAEFMGACVVFDILIGMAYYTKKQREEKKKAYQYVDFKSAVTLLASEIISEKRNLKDCSELILAETSTTEEAVDFVLDYDYTNLLQAWVHLMGNKFRKGFQSIFTNLNLFSPRILKDNFSYYEYPNGDKLNDEYIKEIVKLQLLFAKFFSKGIKGKYGNKVVAMPVVSLMIPNDSVGSEYLQADDDMFVEQVLRYFSRYNNINVYRGVKLAMCCRIVVEKHEHKVDVNSLGVVSGSNGNDAVGSIRVVTTALTTVAKEIDLSEDVELNVSKYLNKIIEKQQIAKLILESQRKLIYKRHEQGLYSLAKHGWVKFEKLASTLGAVGVFEAVKLISNGDFKLPYTKSELEIADRILETFDDMCAEFCNTTENVYNMEISIPAESMAFRLKDREVLLHGEDSRYTELSNQFTPLTLSIDIVDKLNAENYLSTNISPTGICHINIKGRLNEEQNLNIHKTMWKNYPRIEHYAFNSPICECESGHLEPDSNGDKCVICGGNIVSTTSRSIGYFKDVETSFGKRRSEEFKRRKFTRV